MDLIDRYVYAVTRALPKTQRQEIADELHSDIQDLIDAETNGTGAERVRKVLTELGRPEELAMRYSGTKQYLIGPEWFSSYIEALKKIGLVAFLVVIAIAAPYLFANEPIVSRAINFVLALAGGCIQIAFWVTLTFVILERVKGDEKSKEVLPWTVDSLPNSPLITRKK